MHVDCAGADLTDKLTESYTEALITALIKASEKKADMAAQLSEQWLVDFVHLEAQQWWHSSQDMLRFIISCSNIHK